jgi:transcription-repair coupling factor (superfamily II helicase)
VLDDVRDRFGPLPPSMLVLAGYAQIRLMAERLRIDSIDREGAAVVFKLREDAPLDPVRLMKFLQSRPEVRLVPPALLKLELPRSSAAAASHASRLRASGRRSAPEPASAESWKPGSRMPGGPGQTAGSRQASISWWTARATAGEVTAGFSKAEILKPVAEDPRAEGGLFDRVGGLLAELELLRN